MNYHCVEEYIAGCNNYIVKLFNILHRFTSVWSSAAATCSVILKLQFCANSWMKWTTLKPSSHFRKETHKMLWILTMTAYGISLCLSISLVSFTIPKRCKFSHSCTKCFLLGRLKLNVRFSSTDSGNWTCTCENTTWPWEIYTNFVWIRKNMDNPKGHVKNKEAKVWQSGHETLKMNFP